MTPHDFSQAALADFFQLFSVRVPDITLLKNYRQRLSKVSPSRNCRTLAENLGIRVGQVTHEANNGSIAACRWTRANRRVRRR